MSDNFKDYSDYVKDPRIACKYGKKCFQKNPIHKKKYKHPPTVKQGRNEPHRETKFDIEKNHEKEDTLNGNEGTSHINKKIKIEANSETKAVSTNEDKDNLAQSNASCSNSPASQNNMTARKEVPNEILNESSVQETDLSSQEVCKKFIKEKFLVEMPQDFYDFWDFCKKLQPNNPLAALKSVGLILVGPFDVLSSRFTAINKPDSDYLIHWRYYRDPPEFQTVLKGDETTGYHIGYFRDSPEDPPIFLASNEAKKNGILKQMGENLFASVNFYLEELKRTGDPFKKMNVGKIKSDLLKEAERLKQDLSLKTDSIIARNKKVVTRTFNKIGLVVPYDKKTQQGYRELALDNKALENLLTKLENTDEKGRFLTELQPVITYANIAADECDFGTGIELGWNILSHGVDCLNKTISRQLTFNYKLLKKDAFAKIAEAHMRNRRKGTNLSSI